MENPMHASTTGPAQPDTAAASSPTDASPSHGVGHGNGRGNGPKFEVNIEGTFYPWDRDTITVSDLRRLAGLPADQPIELIDLKTNIQRTLGEQEVVELKPGLGFSKKVKFQRG